MKSSRIDRFWELIQEKQLSPAESITFLFFVHFGVSHRSMRQIGQKVGLSNRQVRRHIRSLEKKGFLEVSREWREDGGAVANSYKVMF
jgi:predicted ArsR family transcriptional regulator